MTNDNKCQRRYSYCNKLSVLSYKWLAAIWQNEESKAFCVFVARDFTFITSWKSFALFRVFVVFFFSYGIPFSFIRLHMFQLLMEFCMLWPISKTKIIIRRNISLTLCLYDAHQWDTERGQINKLYVRSTHIVELWSILVVVCLMSVSTILNQQRGEEIPFR